MIADSSYDPGSFRDRSGRVCQYDGRIYRLLSAEALEEWEFVARTEFARRHIAAGSFVATERACDGELPPHLSKGWAGTLKHETIPFISYPYEWSFHMLRDAALLHLDLMAGALREGVILKDATPYNTQFRGSQCVFIDAASLVKYRPGDTWMGYRQFCQTMLYPLLLQSYRDLEFQPLLRGRLDGITPTQCLNMLRKRDLLRAGVFTHVYLHSKLETRAIERPQGTAESLRDEGFGKELIQNNVRKLTRIVEGLKWTPRHSTWSEYDVSQAPPQLDGAVKEEFVGQVAAGRRWRLVWDLGCNVGRYSRLCAKHADYVVALDFDHLAIDRLYQSLKAEQQRSILPLVFNVTDPSPGLGWRGRERRDLAARGKPELVLALALIHHLVLRENLLLPDVVDWLASLNSAAVIEFVDKSDPQSQLLLANRVDQYADYSREAFEKLIGERFAVRRTASLPTPTRKLYYVEPLS
jgi:hypothetical protein